MTKINNVTAQMVLDLYDLIWESPESGEDESDWIYEVLSECPIFKNKFKGDLPYKINILNQEELNGIYVEFKKAIVELEKIRKFHN